MREGVWMWRRKVRVGEEVVSMVGVFGNRMEELLGSEMVWWG